MSIFKKDKDTNWVSFYEDGNCSEPAWSGQHLDGSPYWTVRDMRFVPVFPEKFDDVVRLHKARGYHFQRCVIDGNGVNREDGLDLNYGCERNLFDECIIAAGRNLAITCKGGSSLNTWRNCVIRGRGKIVDVEFGNHSDQSRAESRENLLHNLTHEDGKPVRIAWGYRGERPTIVGGNVKIVWWWVAVLHVYTFAKEKLRFLP